MSKQVSFDLMSHEGYRKTWDALMSLREKISQAEEEAQKLYNEGKTESVKTQRVRQVEAILSGVEPDEVQPVEQWRENLSKAKDRIYLLREAEKEQVRRLEQARLKASEVICEAVRPKYAEVVREIAKRLIPLGEILLQEQALRESLNDGQIAYQAHNLLPHPFLSTGNPYDYQSRIAYWMREAVERGYLGIEDIPQEWLDAWFMRDGYKLEKPTKSVDQVLSRARKESKVEDESEWSVEA